MRSDEAERLAHLDRRVSDRISGQGEQQPDAARSDEGIIHLAIADLEQRTSDIDRRLMQAEQAIAQMPQRMDQPLGDPVASDPSDLLSGKERYDEALWDLITTALAWRTIRRKNIALATEGTHSADQLKSVLSISIASDKLEASIARLEALL